jgi:protein O-GlcNAc transferase
MWQLSKFIWTILFIAGLSGIVACSSGPGERTFNQAVDHYERGEWVRARDLFDQSIQQRPGHGANAYAWHYLGLIAWQLDDPEEAMAHFERSHELNPSLFEPTLNLGILALVRDDKERAHALFTEAAEQQPQDARPWEYLAHLDASRGRYPQAREALLQALEREPQSARIPTALAVLEWEEGESAEAIAYCMQALERRPGYPPALYNLARLYAQWPEQRHHALAYYRQYLNAAPASPHRTAVEQQLAQWTTGQAETTSPAPAEPAPEQAPETPPPTLDEQLELARSAVAAGQRERAVAAYLRIALPLRRAGQIEDEARVRTEAVRQIPESATLQLELGRFYLDQQQYAQALAPLRRATALEPEWAHAWSRLGDCAAALEEYTVAVDAYRRVVSLRPEDAGALWRLAEFYELAGARRRAVETYELFQQQFFRDPRAVQAAAQVEQLRPPPPPAAEPPPPPEPPPRSPEAERRRAQAQEAYQRGVSYERRRDWESALLFYARAIAEDAEFEPAHYQTGIVLYQLRRFQEAWDAFQQSVTLAPEKAPAWYNLALVEYELGRKREALPSLNTALRLDPDYAPAHLLIGIIYGEDPATVNRTRQHYQDFLRLQPNDPNAATVREWLERN